MGGTESSEGRRVSFGMDEEERVRVLQGIRLSENVVNLMKESNQPSKVGQLTFLPALPPSTFGTSKGPEKGSRLPRSEYGSSQTPSGVEGDLLKRYKKEQAVVQDELFQVVMKKREATTKYRSAFLHRGEGSVDQEKQKSALMLALELDSQARELRCQNTLYKEQLAHIERKNAEMYKLSSQQFHEAASKMEGTIKPRRLEPVCSGLQVQILRCYSDHLHEVLLCSDLVKAYQHCVTAAHKGSEATIVPDPGYDLEP
ncbi:MICOS complex subunit MIC25 [Phyllostomus hastatus]|uniref:MICOS complex subunit MIC25 n=1 Tax=Phyllostomus hastatus TaxID=9423 RepID=UPI001E681125|nr:MICOS complex subunit MIC25 [Phyllostomus hastatus]